MSEPLKRPRFWGSQAASGLALISPTALYAILLLAAPLAATLVYSVMTDGYLTVIPQFQLCNYVGECHSQLADGTMSPDGYLGAWSDPIVRTLLARSLPAISIRSSPTLRASIPC